ncbi:hypothetical protein SM124_01425 [Bacillus sp. 31A1R]|uniref:Type III restriction enzyme, res subunit n=1 Tax=Robertmurraya mangrovi TaxID=3098077 RepID=A0ABU5ITE4_9BACI|nr:hypothetical protein [Bacillus sp. 31A1R]MDZ5470398.1 hypothetical protein [Bacillus sp. 31A1R]
MRTIQLVKDLQYNKKYETINGQLNYDNYSYYLDKQDRILYEAEEVCELSDQGILIVENIVEGYKQLFIERKIIPTEAQLNFARTTAKILIGKLNNKRTVPVIPAPCGFGKSTITYVFLREVCKAMSNGLITEGLIIVTDKLSELKKTHSDLEKEIGFYKIEKTENGKELETSFTYVLEGWTDRSFEEGVCLNKKVKYYKNGMCSNEECSFYKDCKMSKQRTIQQFSPILLMTNARLETFGESINQYNYYIDKEGNKQSRTMIINDEKPKMINSIRVSIPLINDIEKELFTIPVKNESEQKEKIQLISKWDYIRSRIRDTINLYSTSYERFLVSNINDDEILLNDNDFMYLWNKLMKNRYKNELEHIHTVLTKGGMFCDSKNKNGIFISTISMKEIINEDYKTVIFDATALVDPDYSSVGVYEQIIKYIDIESVRTFENVTFNFYQAHKINKSTLRTKEYLTAACVKFIETIPKNVMTYVVTYNEVAPKMLKKLKEGNKILIKGNENEYWGNSNKVELVSYDDDTLFYFGNTKGSNKAKDCLQMVQIGWNTLPDYEYSIRYLCTNFSQERMDDIFQKCSKPEIAERFSKSLVHGEDYKFDNPNLYLLQKYSMVTDFIQEVFRTKLRNYNFNGKVEIHCFQSDSVLIGMVEQFFPKCNINILYNELSCFQEEKVTSRKNGDKATLLLNFVNNWEIGNQYTTKEICKATGLTTNDIDNLKRKNTFFKETFEKYKVKRGIFIKK